MIFIYILFFISLNSLIFSVFINDKILKVNSLTKKLILIYLLLIIFLHLFFLKEEYLNNNKFLQLIFSSLMIIVFYFGSKIPIKIAEKNNKINDNIKNAGLDMFNFSREYLIPIMVALVQVAIILDL